MQNVMWPIMIVYRLNVIPKLLIDAFNAIPVTMPGSAIGSRRRNEMEFLPKNRNRWTANAARLPSASATTVATDAITREFARAEWRSLLCHACAQYFVVKRVDRPLLPDPVVERVDEHQRERHVQEQQREHRPRPDHRACEPGLHRSPPYSASNAPARLARSMYTAITATGTSA